MTPSCLAERWLSGRKQRFAKPSYGQKLYRGFESPPLRQKHRTIETLKGVRMHWGQKVILNTVRRQWGPVANGVLWGIAVWSAYGILDFAFFYSSQLFESDQAVFTPIAWKLNAVCLCFYIAAGAVAGAVSTAAAVRLAPGAIRKFGACALPASLTAVITWLPRSQPRQESAASESARSWSRLCSRLPCFGRCGSRTRRQPPGRNSVLSYCGF